MRNHRWRQDAVVGTRGPGVRGAERVGGDTVLGQIVRLVAEAQRSRAPIQRLADVVARVFVPAVVGVAVLTFVAWALFGPRPRLAHALVNAIAVLIIACPCALGLATPMSIMVAMGKAATAGVLFKNAEAIESLRTVDTVVVDKTGNPNTIKYSDVKSLGGKNLSTGVKIAIGVAIGVGATLGLLAALFFSANR